MNISFQDGAATLGISLPDRAMAQFATYRDALLAQNQVINLTAITNPAEVDTRHFLDSLALTQVADFSGKRMIDIGTGAGFPGLPLKIAHPDLTLTLLDSLGKRIQFLDDLSTTLGLSDITCVHARAEEWVSTANERAGYDIATSRAVARLNVLVELCLPYLRVGGVFLAMKSADCDDEIAEAHVAIQTLGGAPAEIHD